ncbi:MAG: hypothetical protein QXT63_03955 [Thermoplasmata archaeon]
MRIEIIKKYSKEHIRKEIAKLEKKYKGLDELRERCFDEEGYKNNPGLLDDFFYWHALNSGAEVYESISTYNYSILSDLTEKRLEIIDYLSNTKSGHIRSIKDIASELKRDYKNVYDDIMALQKNGLIEFLKAGNKTKPIMLIERITIELKDK